MSNKRRKTTNNFKGQEKSTYILLEQMSWSMTKTPSKFNTTKKKQFFNSN